jgi:hypothetical protein
MDIGLATSPSKNKQALILAIVRTTRALAQAVAVTNHNMTTGNKNACGCPDPARTAHMHNLKQQTTQHTTQARQ